MKTMSAMAIYRMKTMELLKGVATDHDDYPTADVQVKLIDNGVRVGVIANEEGCVLLCDDFECEEGQWNAYWFCEDEEIEFGLVNDYDPDSYYLDDDMIDGILNKTDSMLEYLSGFVEEKE